MFFLSTMKPIVLSENTISVIYLLFPLSFSLWVPKQNSAPDSESIQEFQIQVAFC